MTVGESRDDGSGDAGANQPALTWIDDVRFRVDDVEFEYSFAKGATARHFHIRKPRPLVEETVDLLRRQHCDNIVELGIADGGSTALLAMVASPRKLVAVELAEERVPALDEFIAGRSLSEAVRPYFGVDQSDRARLAEIARDEFGREPIDLVIDDASHQFEETRASFETLFPLLRPDGRYVIEDWGWQLRFLYLVAASIAGGAGGGGEANSTSRPDEVAPTWGHDVARNWAEKLRPIPLEKLVAQLVLARACSGDAIRELAIGEHWVEIRRGPAELDPESFRVEDTYLDTQGILAD